MGVSVVSRGEWTPLEVHGARYVEKIGEVGEVVVVCRGG